LKRISAFLTVLAFLLPTLLPAAVHAAGIDGTVNPMLLAQADISADSAPPTAIEQAIGRGDGTPKTPRHRWLTPNKLHQYLGLAALGLGVATGLSAGLADEGEDGGSQDGGAHETIAIAATAMASAAAVSGFLYHREDIGFDKPLNDPDNLHMALTAAGVLGFIGATALGGEDGHSALGILGGLSMLIGVKITW